MVQKHSNGTWFPLVDVPKTLSKYNDSQVIGNNGSQSLIDFKDIVEMKIVEEHQ
ncbi:hypothetical protein [Lysinibacillus sp. Y5S-8]|uniref:hypothetical protein n=1 Tax=Lysinibacillus sp. Y5S-8 TaxID=3122488 RepID=UPI0030D355A1